MPSNATTTSFRLKFAFKQHVQWFQVVQINNCRIKTWVFRSVPYHWHVCNDGQWNEQDGLWNTKVSPFHTVKRSSDAFSGQEHRFTVDFAKLIQSVPTGSPSVPIQIIYTSTSISLLFVPALKYSVSRQWVSVCCWNMRTELIIYSKKKKVQQKIYPSKFGVHETWDIFKVAHPNN